MGVEPRITLSQLMLMDERDTLKSEVQMLTERWKAAENDALEMAVVADRHRAEANRLRAALANIAGEPDAVMCLCKFYRETARIALKIESGPR